MEAARCERGEWFAIAQERFSSFGQLVKGTHEEEEEQLWQTNDPRCLHLSLPP
jgi:hypothetical protein